MGIERESGRGKEREEQRKNVKERTRGRREKGGSL